MLSRIIQSRRVLGFLVVCAALVPAGAATRVALGLSPPPSHLLFTSNRDGDSDVYAIDPAGRRLAALTVNKREDVNLVVSSDGRHVAYRRDGLYVADGAGRHAKKVDGLGSPAGWSPDGSRLAFWTGPEGAELDVVSADGARRQVVANAGEGGTFPEFEGWSRGGSELAYTRYSFDPATGDTRSELLVAPIGGPAQVLTSAPGEALFSAAWSPTANVLAYHRLDEAQQQSQLAVTDLESGATAVLATGSSGPPVWSPDGSRLVYSTPGPLSLQGTLKMTDLRNQTTVGLATADGLGPDADPVYVWSPSGLRVAFTDWLGLFVVGADGQGRRLLRRGSRSLGPTGTITQPTWSPDGTAIAFQDEGLRVIRADGSDLQTLATRGTIEIGAWVSGAVTNRAPRATSLPPQEIGSSFLLRSRGRIKQLVTSGANAAVLTRKSTLDCEHVFVWTGRTPMLVRASRPIPCGAYEVSRLGGLDIHGRQLRWSSEWGCGNSECDRVSYAGQLLAPTRLRVREKLITIFFDVGHRPSLPCVVCGRPNPTSRMPDVVPGHVAMYVRRRTIYLRLQQTRSVKVLRPPGVGRVLARLTHVGLFYAFNLEAGSYPGRVAFIPLATLRR